MRQGGGQANPDPPSPEPPSPPPRRRGWRRWRLVLLLTPLGPLTAGVFGWLYPSKRGWGFGCYQSGPPCTSPRPGKTARSPSGHDDHAGSRWRWATRCCVALRALLARGWRAERPCLVGPVTLTSSWTWLAAGGGVAMEGATGQHYSWDKPEQLAAHAPAAGPGPPVACYPSLGMSMKRHWDRARWGPKPCGDRRHDREHDEAFGIVALACPRARSAG
jgi:hypothetical protein